MYAKSEIKLNHLEEVLRHELLDKGVLSICIIDQSGNIVIYLNYDPSDFDIFSLASLSAAYYEGLSAMANMLGEEEMTLLFHEGKNLSIYLKKIKSDFLLISIFDKSISLGFLRLKIDKLDGLMHSCL